MEIEPDELVGDCLGALECRSDPLKRLRDPIVIWHAER
jgi:hypothetical protein